MKEGVTVKPRIDYLDAVKFFAIFLMIWGHCMTILENNVGLNDEHISLVSLLYKFNMPLFFFVSGLFIEGILKKSFWQILLSKAKQLILPAVIFAVIDESIKVFILRYNDFSDFILHIRQITNFHYWFCLYLFYSILLFYISRKVIKNKYVADITALLIFIVFGIKNSQCEGNLYIFLLSGIYLRDYVLYKKINILSTLVLVSIFIGLFILYDKKPDIYDNLALYNIRENSFNWHNLTSSSTVYISGLSASVAIILIFRLLYIYRERGAFFVKWGKESLYFYLLNFILIKDIMAPILWYIDITMDKTIFIYLFTPVLACITIAMSLPIIKLIRRYNLLP